MTDRFWSNRFYKFTCVGCCVGLLLWNVSIIFFDRSSITWISTPSTPAINSKESSTLSQTFLNIDSNIPNSNKYPDDNKQSFTPNYYHNNQDRHEKQQRIIQHRQYRQKRYHSKLQQDVFKFASDKNKTTNKNNVISTSRVTKKYNPNHNHNPNHKDNRIHNLTAGKRPTANDHQTLVDQTSEIEYQNNLDSQMIGVKHTFEDYLRWKLFDSVKNKVNPICYKNLPLFVEFGSHHKTGYRFSRDLFESLFQFCHLPLRNQHARLTHMSRSQRNKMKMRMNQVKQNTSASDVTQFAKSGVISMRNIGNSGSNSNNHPFRSLHDASRRYLHPNAHWPYEIPNINYFINNFNIPMILIHFIRSPLHTVVSGFNYHAKCPEKWLQCSISTKQCMYGSLRWQNMLNYSDDDHGINSSVINVNSRLYYRWNTTAFDIDTINYDINANRLKNTSKTRTNDRLMTYDTFNQICKNISEKYTFDARNNAYSQENCMIKRVAECFAKNQDHTHYLRRDTLEYIFHSKVTTCGLLKNHQEFPNVIERVYFELIRYINCEFEEIYQAYTMIESYQYGYNFKMEDYTSSSQNYDQFLNTLIFDIFGFEFETKPGIPLTENKQYKSLLTYLRKHDLNRWTDSKAHHNSHVTSMSDRKLIDPDNAIQGILSYHYQSDDSVIINSCELIKQRTLKLNYHWDEKFNRFC